jgi:hypothetical protein
VHVALWCQPCSQEWSVCFLFVRPSMGAWCVICMHGILIFAGCRTGERRASCGGRPPCAHFLYRLCHHNSCCPALCTLLCSDYYVILGFSSLGVESMNLCVILLDVCRGMAAFRIPVSFYIASFDEQLTCRVSLHGYQLLRATWFGENLSVKYLFCFSEYSD